MAPEFLDVALDRLPAAAIPGFDPAAPLPDTLYGAPIEITALDPTRRLLVLLPAARPTWPATCWAAQSRPAAARSVSFCEGTGEQMCIVERDGGAAPGGASGGLGPCPAQVLRLPAADARAVGRSGCAAEL